MIMVPTVVPFAPFGSVVGKALLAKGTTEPYRPRAFSGQQFLASLVHVVVPQSGPWSLLPKGTTESYRPRVFSGQQFLASLVHVVVRGPFWQKGPQSLTDREFFSGMYVCMYIYI